MLRLSQTGGASGFGTVTASWRNYRGLMISVVNRRRSVHAGDDVEGHGRRGELPDGTRLGEVVLMALIDVYRDTRQVTREHGGRPWTETLGDGEESCTVRPTMSERELRRPLADVMRPSASGEHVSFASGEVQPARSWELFRARTTMGAEEEAAET